MLTRQRANNVNIQSRTVHPEQPRPVYDSGCCSRRRHIHLCCDGHHCHAGAEDYAMISITGLSNKQKVLMDVMWAMDTMPAVEAFIKSLPKRDQQDCQSLVAIAVQESLEEDNRLDDYEAIALSVIARVSSR